MNLKAEVVDWEEKLLDINNQTKELGRKTLKIQVGFVYICHIVHSFNS